jgi:hypothetical protein
VARQSQLCMIDAHSSLPYPRSKVTALWSSSAQPSPARSPIVSSLLHSLRGTNGAQIV